LPAQTTKWFETYGRGNAAAFDRYGWQYFVRGVFDFFYVGYWDEWATFQGATGMTYETDGGPEFRKRRDDGSITTFRDGIAHHFRGTHTSAPATQRRRGPSRPAATSSISTSRSAALPKRCSNRKPSCSARSSSASSPSSTATAGAGRMPTRRSTDSTTSPPGP